MYNVIEIYDRTAPDPVTGATKTRADLAGSTKADIPDTDNDNFLPDSWFYARKEGAFYCKDDDGKWYDTDGNAAE